MTQYLSDKIKILSFISIILVLYIHSSFHNYPHEIQGMVFNNNLQDFISGMLGRCAVPLFYMISGYLFFLNTDGGMVSVFGKMHKRVRTLLVPYLIGCIFTPLFLVIIENVPGANSFMNGGGMTSVIKELSVIETIKYTFFSAPNGSPWAFHLWFLRDLLVIVCVSPILYLIRGYINRWVLIVLLLVGTYMLSPVLAIQSLFFFMLGSLLKLENITIKSDLYTYALTLLFIFISIVQLIYVPVFHGTVGILIILLGCLSMWNIYDRIVPISFSIDNSRYVSIVVSCTFFIYLFHMPTLNIIRKLMLIPCGKTSIGFALSYLLSPWVFVIIFVFIGYFMRKHMSRLYSILVGGR